LASPRLIKVISLRETSVYICNDEHCVFCEVRIEFSITTSMNLSLWRDKLCCHQIWAFEGINYADTKYERSKGWTMLIPNLNLRR